MAELARMRPAQHSQTVPVREHLRTLEDGDVVSAFLAGEERFKIEWDQSDDSVW